MLHLLRVSELLHPPTLTQTTQTTQTTNTNTKHQNTHTQHLRKHLNNTHVHNFRKYFHGVVTRSRQGTGSGCILLILYFCIWFTFGVRMKEWADGFIIIVNFPFSCFSQISLKSNACYWVISSPPLYSFTFTL